MGIPRFSKIGPIAQIRSPVLLKGTLVDVAQPIHFAIFIKPHKKIRKVF
jgi:hypothetical protein